MDIKKKGNGPVPSKEKASANTPNRCVVSATNNAPASRQTETLENSGPHIAVAPNLLGVISVRAPAKPPGPRNAMGPK